MSRQKLNSKRVETTRRILNTAAEIFSESGFEGARVDEIAKRAGVNKATIYYHIGDKEALYARVIHDLFGNAAQQIVQNINASLSPRDKLKTYIDTLAGIVDQNPQIAAIMLREQAAGGKNLPEVVARDIAGIVGVITDILDEGVEGMTTASVRSANGGPSSTHLRTRASSPTGARQNRSPRRLRNSAAGRDDRLSGARIRTRLGAARQPAESSIPLPRDTLWTLEHTPSDDTAVRRRTTPRSP